MAKDRRKCRGINRITGKIKRGWRVNPNGGCPVKGMKAKRASGVAKCKPLIKKGLKHGIHRGIKDCLAALPSDVRSEWTQRVDYSLAKNTGKLSGLFGAARKRKRKSKRSR